MLGDLIGGRCKVRALLSFVAEQDIFMRVGFYASIYSVMFLAGLEIGKFIGSTF